MRVDPGSELAGYRIEALLGVGAFARVYRVHHLESGTTRALKILNSVSERKFERLRSEWRSQRHLDHPNLVKSFELLSLPDGHGALAMEYVDGVTLRTWLIQNPKPKLSEIDAIITGVGEGLAAAHRRGVVHRDLKPGNIMLAGGRPSLPRVVDFGYAKLLADDGGLTQTGSTLGTPTYSSPEQVRDAKRVDSRSDIFSLGCLLYRMSCGVVPFDGDTSVDVYRNIVSGEFVPPEERRGDLPDRYYRAMRSALRYDAQYRPATVSDWLRIFLGQESWGERVLRSAAEVGLMDYRWWGIVGGVAALVVTLGWAAVAIVGALQAPDRVEPPARFAGTGVPQVCRADDAETGWIRLQNQELTTGDSVTILANTPLRMRPAGPAICLLPGREARIAQIDRSEDGSPWGRVELR